MSSSIRRRNSVITHLRSSDVLCTVAQSTSFRRIVCVAGLKQGFANQAGRLPRSAVSFNYYSVDRLQPFAVIHHPVGLAGGRESVDAADDSTRVFARPHWERVECVMPSAVSCETKCRAKSIPRRWEATSVWILPWPFTKAIDQSAIVIASARTRLLRSRKTP